MFFTFYSPGYPAQTLHLRLKGGGRLGCSVGAPLKLIYMYIDLII